MACGCVSISVDVVKLLSFIPSILGNGVRYVAGLSRSRNSVLSAEANRLRVIRRDIEETVRAQERIFWRKRTNEVEQWLKDAAGLIGEVERFEGSRIHRLPCLKDCPCWATSMLEHVLELKDHGADLRQDPLQMLGKEPLRTSDEVPFRDPQILGREDTLSEVLGHLRNDVKIVGIHGMPGIGKTALLQKIYHELIGGSKVVVYAEVSMEPNIRSLQRKIAEGLGLTLAEDGPSTDAPPPETRHARTLIKELSQTESVLLLDDVWEGLDWKKIGIPSPDDDLSRCQIMFTTPLRRMCIDMEAGHIVGIGNLSAAQSWELFCLEVGIPVYNLSTAARKVINRCGGLPRAVITLSRHVLREREAPNFECNEIVEKLKHWPHEISGMKKMVLSPLECTLDKLEEKTNHQMEEWAVEMRQCLLYCSLFPEEQDICIDRLIDYWIGEGFIDAKCYLIPSAARDKGREIVKTLMNERFLEGIASNADDQYSWEVKLHDVVRGMAMWLTDGRNISERSPLFLTSARLKDSTHGRWEKAARISSMDNGPKVFPSSKIKCPDLSTFLFNNYSVMPDGPLQYSELHPAHCNNIEGGGTLARQSVVQGEPSNLFEFAKALRVLDLSGTKIETLPAAIGNIDELQYLNLSHTNIRYLPTELNNLQKLRQLRLRGTHRLSSIPKKFIDTKLILQIFDLFDSGYCWRPAKRIRFLEAQIELSNLTKLTNHNLKEVGLTLTDLPLLERSCSTFPDNKLPKSTVFLMLKDIVGLSQDHLSSVFRGMENLQELSISMGINSADTVTNLKIEATQLPKLQVLDMHNLTSLSSIDLVGVGTGCSFLKNLRHLHISNCPGLTDVTWVHQLSSLVEIALWDCQGVDEVVGNHCSSLPTNLKKIYLFGLPNLTKIAGRPLISSPSLEIVSVAECPLLKVLSFDTETAKRIKEIRGEREWWDGLQWDENDATRSVLETCFKVASRRSFDATVL